MGKKYLFFLYLFLFQNVYLKAQNDTLQNFAKVYLIRHTGYIGSAGKLKVFLDSSIICKISNNRISLLNVKDGIHTFSVKLAVNSQPSGKFDLNIKLDKGKTYYLKIVLKQRFLEIQTFFEEITYNSAKVYLEKLKSTKNCD